MNRRLLALVGAGFTALLIGVCGYAVFVLSNQAYPDYARPSDAEQLERTVCTNLGKRCDLYYYGSNDSPSTSVDPIVVRLTEHDWEVRRHPDGEACQPRKTTTACCTCGLTQPGLECHFAAIGGR